MLVVKKGLNAINRTSSESNVALAYENTFKNFEKFRYRDSDDYCGCGWPENMMIPKGNVNGHEMVLFIMITDYEYDKVWKLKFIKFFWVNTFYAFQVNQPNPSSCQDGFSLCGLKGLAYPDAKSMGFPFNRISESNVKHLSDFLLSNMKTIDLTIKFLNITRNRRKFHSQ